LRKDLILPDQNMGGNSTILTDIQIQQAEYLHLENIQVPVSTTTASTESKQKVY